MEQLLFSGVMEAVHIRQAGYPLRMEFDTFLQRYGAVVPKKLRARRHGSKTRAWLETVVQTLPTKLGANIVASDFALGFTKVFCRTVAHKALERERKFAFSSTHPKSPSKPLHPPEQCFALSKKGKQD